MAERIDRRTGLHRDALVCREDDLREARQHNAAFERQRADQAVIGRRFEDRLASGIAGLRVRSRHRGWALDIGDLERSNGRDAVAADHRAALSRDHHVGVVGAGCAAATGDRRSAAMPPSPGVKSAKPSKISADSRAAHYLRCNVASSRSGTCRPRINGQAAPKGCRLRELEGLVALLVACCE